jgi:hypothetical protein
LTAFPMRWHSGVMDPVIPPAVMFGLARDILRKEMGQRIERRREVGRDTPDGVRLTSEISTLVQLGQSLDETAAKQIIAAGRAAIEARLAPPRMPRCDASDLHAQFPDLLAENAQVWVGSGWRAILDEAFDALKGRSVIVHVAREDRAGLRLVVGSVADWREADFDLAAAVADRTWSRSLKICETCGAPAASGPWSRYRTRCTEHAEER